MLVNNRRPRSVCLFLLVGLVGIACGDDGGVTEPSGVSIESVAVSPDAATLVTLGETFQLDAVATDADGATVSDVRFVWQSSRPGVVSVDTTGLATAEGPGEATITATARGVPGNAVLTVNQEISGLAFITEPTDVAAGDAIDPAIRVEIRDAQGSRVADSEAGVTLSLAADPGGATLTGTRTVSATSGVATFGGLWLDRAASGYTLEATLGGAMSVTSASFTVTPGEVARLGFVGQPSDAVAGDPIVPEVEVRAEDAFGNPVVGASGEVTLALAANPGGGVLFGGAPTSLVDGSATFSGLWVDKAAQGYTLRAEAPELDPAVSGTFGITPAGAAKLAFATEPSEAEVSGAITPPVEVAIQDEFGNTVGGATNTVTLDLTERPKDARFHGTLAVGATDGVATFPDLAVDWIGRGYGLSATAGGVNGVESALFNVALTLDEVSLGNMSSCGLGSAGSVVCWGRNGRLELGGDGRIAESCDGGSIPCNTTPGPSVTSEAGPVAFSQIEGGASHTCGVATDGDAFCWGLGNTGQLGNSATEECQTGPLAGVLACTSFALQVLDPSTGAVSWSSVTGGANHSCGISTPGDVYCWGSGDLGQRGGGAAGSAVLLPEAVTDPPSGAVTWTEITAGRDHTCGLTDAGEIFCWGLNSLGQLGTASSETCTDEISSETHPCSTTPLPVDDPASGPVTWASVDAGGDHTCAVTTGNEAFCWGSDSEGELGDGGALSETCGTAALPCSTVPFPVADPAAGPLEWSAVSAGGEELFFFGGSAHTCALSTGGAAYCWGNNDFGQLGDGGMASTATPVAVSGGQAWTSISSGTIHTCGVTSGGQGRCWGSNSNGHLGDGSEVDSPTPVPVEQR